MDGWCVFSRDTTKLPTAPKESQSQANDRSDMWMEWAIMPFVAWISVKLQMVLLCPPIATWLENCAWVDFEPIWHPSPSHLVWFLKPIHPGEKGKCGEQHGGKRNDVGEQVDVGGSKHIMPDVQMIRFQEILAQFCMDCCGSLI